MRAAATLLLICSMFLPGTALAQVELPGATTDGGRERYATVGYLSGSYAPADRWRLNGVGYYSPELDLTLFDVGASWAALPWLTLGGSYLRLDAENDFAANYIRGYATLSATADDCRISLRNIVEHRIIENGLDDQTRYRPRFELSHSVEIGAAPVTAFAQVEPFYDITEGELDRVWWGGGVRVGLLENLSLQAEYIRQEEDSNGDDINAFVLGLIVRFD